MSKTMTFEINKPLKSNVKLVYQSYSSAVASLSILIAAFWTMYISPVILKFRKQEMTFNISAAEEVWIVSIMDFGNLLSAIPGGLAMDKCGRKYTLLLSAVIYLTASIFAIFATAGKYLFAARLLAGIGKGFSFTVAPIYVSEISSKSVRGALSSTFYGFFCAGIIVVAGIGPYVSYQELNYIGLALTIVFVLLMLPIPESMYYYIMRNKPDKAEKSLWWFRHTESDYQKLQTDGELAEIKIELETKSSEKAEYMELLTKSSYRRAFIIVSLASLAQRFGGISYMLSYGVSDLPDSEQRFGRDECFVVFSISSLTANIVSAALVDRIGRKPILLFSLIVTSISMFVGSVYFSVHPAKMGLPYIDRQYYWIPYGAVIVFSFTFTFGLGAIPATFQGELFPAKIKRHASAVVVMVASLGSFLVNCSHEIVTEHFGVAGNYLIPAISSLLFAIWAHICVFETKGKTLLQIQNKLMSRR